MNKDDIFNLFEDNPEEKKIQTVTVEEFLENSQVEVGVFQIGMFTKLISNHHVFHAKLKKFFEKKVQIPRKNLGSSSRMMVKNGIYSY